MNKESTKEILKKETPTIFPFGFSIGRLDSDVVILDFLDISSKSERKIISSIALSTTKAKELADALLGALEYHEPKDEKNSN